MVFSGTGYNPDIVNYSNKVCPDWSSQNTNGQSVKWHNFSGYERFNNNKNTHTLDPVPLHLVEFT